MATFPGQVELQMPVNSLALIKMHPPLHQIGNARRPLAHDRAHSGLFAQTRTGDERVAHMLFDGVVLRRHTGDAALRPV